MDSMLRAYLERLRLAEVPQDGLELLRAVQRQSLAEIPYENLDILQGVPLRFGTDELAEKLLERRRGGVCYELNFRMEEVLRRLGLDTALLSGIVAGGAGGDFAHALVLAQLPQGRYIADAGFGRGYLRPLRLDEEDWQWDGRFRYRLRREGDWYLLEREKSDGTVTEEYRFTDTPRRREEYREMCDFLCASPQCKFTYMLVCSRELPEGRLTLRDDFLLMERPGQSPEAKPVTEEERDRLLWERFRLPPRGGTR